MQETRGKHAKQQVCVHLKFMRYRETNLRCHFNINFYKAVQRTAIFLAEASMHK